MSSEQARAQFDWLQERLKDPHFIGISLCNSGGILSVATLRCIKDGDELSRLLHPKDFPITPIEK